MEELVLNRCSQSQDGVTAEDLAKSTGLTLPQIMDVVNPLLAAHKLQMFTDAITQTPIFRAYDLAEASKIKNLSPEEMLVYQSILAAGNTGLWTKDMRARTNLQQPQITKIIKALENRKLIKAVKSVASANRKVYMAFDVEPAREISGGAWYTEHEFDAEFISTLRQACINFIEREGYVTVDDVAEFIRGSNLTKVELTNEDYSSILETLILDGIVEKNVTGAEAIYQRVTHEPLKTTALTSMPCGVCPVAADCTPDGVISPATCVYYQHWLAF